MAAKYRKIDPRMWHDEKFVSLTHEEKLLAIYIITAQSNRAGIFFFSIGMAAEDLGSPSEALAKPFGRVVEALGWKWDCVAKVIYLPTWFKYNEMESPNNVKGCLSDLNDLPKTELLKEFASNITHIKESHRQLFLECLPACIISPSEALRKPFGSPSEALGNSGAGAGAGTGTGTGTGAGNRPGEDDNINFSPAQNSFLWSSQLKGRKRDDQKIVYEFFCNLQEDLGVPGETVAMAIKEKSRDRSEHFWQFKNRILKNCAVANQDDDQDFNREFKKAMAAQEIKK